MKTPALLVALLSLPLAAQQIHTSIVRTPLDADNLAIYRDFLSGYDNGSGAVLNVANTTEAFLNATPVSDEQKSCLSDVHITRLSSAVVHKFSADAFPADKVRLVDPATYQRRDPSDAIRTGKSIEDAVHAGFAAGLFTFSEIVFDATHTHAAFQYSFVCGRLCGSGGTVLYDKRPDDHGKPGWQLSRKICGSWIS